MSFVLAGVFLGGGGGGSVKAACISCASFSCASLALCLACLRLSLRLSLRFLLRLLLASGLFFPHFDFLAGGLVLGKGTGSDVVTTVVVLKGCRVLVRANVAVAVAFVG